MRYQLGFIGCGNMGGALARAAARSVGKEQLALANRTAKKAESLAWELGCAAVSNEEVARSAKFIFLGVKPQMMAELLSSLAPILQQREDRFLLISMAAGLTTDQIAQMAGGRCPIIRIMPNTAVSIGEGIVLYAANDAVTPAELDEFRAAMSAAGLLDPLPEHLMDAGSAIAGCGGAFCDLFIEALADGGVAVGLPRAKAQQYAAQMLRGAAGLALQAEKHPALLKDEVCSPGGSTIQGVRALERGGLRSAAMEAVIAAYERATELGK